MRIVQILFFLFSTGVASAQFGQMGAVWTYNDYNSVTHQNFPRAIQTVADTVILGKVCHIVAGECACGSPYPNYVYESSRKVYWYNISLNAFTLLYDFNLDAGAEWTIIAKNAVADSLRLHVDSTGTDTINGVACKVQYISTVATYGLPFVFDGPVVEWIGSKFCLYPQSAACDPPTIGLRCYQDDFLGVYDTHFAPSCEEIFVDSGIGIEEMSQSAMAIFFPNPFHEEAKLFLAHFTSAQMDLIIADATGRVISRKSITPGECRLKREDLPEGIYFYQIISREAVISGKFTII